KCSEAMERYQQEMKTLTRKLLHIIFKAMGARQEDEAAISYMLEHNPSGALQLNSYPTCPNPDRAVGLPPHTDTFLLTVLHQNRTDGLHVFRPDLGWRLVPPVAGAFVVNLGDLMHVLSNARFVNACHRVVPNSIARRVTIGYFFAPAMDSAVAPLPEVLVPKFRSVVVKEYIRLREKHLEKAIDFIR
ncbi:hypothetical protein M569_04751, partial [Genlisea aurea]